MALQNLKYLSQKAHDQLLSEYKENKDRYVNGDFTDLISSQGWNMELQNVQVNFKHFEKLDASSSSAELDIENSLLVWKALHQLTPAIASDSRIWTRITHAEGFEFTRQRWIKIKTFKSDEKLEKAIRRHFFATGLTQYRDDNGIARLWWSAWIAHKVNPDNPREALEILFSSADTRSNIVERPSITTRECLIQPLTKFVQKNMPLSEREVRDFMIAVNLYGGGIVFEALSKTDIKQFLEKCLIIGRENAKLHALDQKKKKLAQKKTHK